MAADRLFWETIGCSESEFSVSDFLQPEGLELGFLIDADEADFFIELLLRVLVK